MNRLVTSLTSAIATLAGVPAQLYHRDSLRALLIAWQCPLNNDPRVSAELMSALCGVLLQLTAAGREELLQLIKTDVSEHIFRTRLLQPLQVCGS